MFLCPQVARCGACHLHHSGRHRQSEPCGSKASTGTNGSRSLEKGEHAHQNYKLHVSGPAPVISRVVLMFIYVHSLHHNAANSVSVSLSSSSRHQWCRSHVAADTDANVPPSSSSNRKQPTSVPKWSQHRRMAEKSRPRSTFKPATIRSRRRESSGDTGT